MQAENNDNAFEMARKNNSAGLKNLILSGLSVNSTDNNSNSLLMLACYKGNFETAKMLIYYGADVNAKNSKGLSILTGASFKGHIDLCKLLVSNNAKIENDITKSPIFFASFAGRVDVVEYFMSMQEFKAKIILVTFAKITHAIKNVIGFLFKK